MNSTVSLSMLSTALFTVTSVLLIVRKRTVDWKNSIHIPLLLSMGLYDFIVISNFLEHSGITDYFDPLEDVAEIVFTFMFIFFINNWRKERSEARFRSLFKLSPTPMAEITRDGSVIRVNENLRKSLKEFFDISFENTSKIALWFENAYPDPDFREWAISKWEKNVENAFETGEPVKPEEREITCWDGTKRTLIIGASIVGENLVASLVDITDRIKADEEKEKLQNQLLQSQKLEAVGNLAGGVAHDFNNMLGAIIGYAELTMDEMPPDHRFRENLSHILDAAQRSAKLTRQLLTFARKQDVVPTIFDINDSVNATLKMLKRLIGENIELEWKPGEGPNIVRMDQTQFDQILANLCLNAKDAISGVGKIIVETSSVLVDGEYGIMHMDYAPGEYVLVSVTDNGCGMDRETMGHIFEPFYTTKEMGKGTGLGLSTVYGIVKQAQGMVNVYSEPGMGTSFNIYLPFHSGEDKAKAGKDDAELPKSRGETILIVEDDKAVLEMGCAILKRLGYDIISADTPAEAVRICESEARGIHLFITDMVMPEMNGKELVETIRKIRPGIKHLFMSGYTANILSQEDEENTKMNFIRKPFSFRDFAKKIREVIDDE